jgi:ribokinase
MPAFVDAVLEDFSAGDVVLLQNEISAIGSIIRKAHEKGMTVFFNPSPVDGQIEAYPLDMVDYFIVNEVEGAHISGKQEPDEILAALRERFANSSFVLTLGPAGARCLGKDGVGASCGVLDVSVVDTTAAGDTFCGYFLSAICGGCAPQEALDTAMVASNIAVTRAGAEPSIPRADEVRELYMRIQHVKDR